MAEIVTHAKFASPERIKALADQGLIVVDNSRNWEDLDLREPQYGEEYLGDLNDEEKALFMALYDAKQEIEDRTRTLMGNKIARVGTTIRDSDRSKPIQEAISEEAELTFDNDQEAIAFFRHEKLTDMLHATFHWNIAERLGAHNYVLGVRTKGRVYKVQRRY